MNLLTYNVITFDLYDGSKNILNKLLSYFADPNIGLPHQGLYPVIVASKIKEISVDVIKILINFLKNN